MSSRGNFSAPGGGGGGSGPSPGGAPPEVRAVSDDGGLADYSRADHTHRSAVTYQSQKAPDQNIVGNRSAEQSATGAGLVGVTNLGNDSTGAAAGVTGDYATLVGGDACSATGQYSTAVGGQSCTASANSSATVGGENNTCDGYASAIVGGDGNTMTGGGSYAGMCGGRFNSASASYASMPGGLRNAVTAQSGTAIGVNAKAYLATQVARASGAYAEGLGKIGTRQVSDLVLRGNTPGAVAGEDTRLGYGGDLVAPGTVAFVTQANAQITFRLTVVCAVTDVGLAGEGSAWVVDGWASDVSGTLTLNSTQTTYVNASASCGAHDVVVSVDGANGLLVTCSVGAGVTQGTRWTADLHVVEVARS